MGYVVDDLAARARYIPDLETDLKALRSELTRVISELRLSIFDLRSEVQTTVGLGTALSDYVRQVGASSKLTVHLVLDESPVRLPIDAETELLRIAQEAVTNARKHANAQNLWVTCRIEPPSAYLRGRGRRRWTRPAPGGQLRARSHARARRTDRSAHSPWETGNKAARRSR